MVRAFRKYLLPGFVFQSVVVADARRNGYIYPMTDRRFVTIAGLLLVTGCALARVSFTPPTVDLTQVRVTGLGLTGGTLDLVFAVHNPNTYELRTTRMDVALALEGTPFGDVAMERAVALPRESATEVTVPLRFTWEGVGAGARALITRGSVQYRLDGRLLVGTPIGDRAVSLSREDVASIRDLTR